MARVAMILTLLAGSTAPAESPAEPNDYGPAGPRFCAVFAEWQAIMRRDHPTADRSVPTIERQCHLPRQPS